jgi:hypothetical protein
MRFIPAQKLFTKFERSGKIIHHITKLKEKIYMTTTKDVDNSDMSQCPFPIIFLGRLEKGNLLW